jgi:hypothetical protein
MRNRTWWRSLVGALCLLATSPLLAQELPSSADSPQGVWDKMRPSSFAGTVDNVVEQCLRNVMEVPGDLTEGDCLKLESLLRAGKCESRLVQDGIVFDLMNGRQGNRSRSWPDYLKQLGESSRAQFCDLGEDLYAYWFTGDLGVSCNNLGWVFPRAQAVLVPLATAVPQRESPGLICRDVPFDGSDEFLLGSPAQFFEVTQVTGGCCSSCNCMGGVTFIPGMFFSNPEFISANGHTRICIAADKEQ